MTRKKNRRLEFVVIWEFHVRSGQRAKFEKSYGSDGVWAKLFRAGKGYICTELIRDTQNPRRYLTLDFWNSRTAYLRFKKAKAAAYQAIDEEFDFLTAKEVKIGEFSK